MEQNFNSNSNLQPVQPIFQQPRSLKITLLIGIFTVIVVFGSYTAIARYSHWWPFRVVVLSPTPSTNPNSDTPGWQKYKNEQFGFEFKYPNDWNIIDDTDKSRVVTLSAKKSDTQTDEEFRPDLFLDINATNDKTVDDYIKSLGECGNVQKELNIAGYKAVKYGTCGPNTGISWLVGNQIYSIYYLEVDDNTINQIVSTFKFNSKVDTSEWKTFNNLGFAMKYPPDWSVVEYPVQWSGNKNGELQISIYGPKADLSSINIKYYASLSDLPLNPVTNRPYDYFDQYINDSHFFRNQKLIPLNSGRATSALTTSGNPTYYVLLVGGNGHFYEIQYQPRYSQTRDELQQIVSTFKFVNNSSTNSDLIVKWDISFNKGSTWSTQGNTDSQIVLEETSGINKGDKITITQITSNSITDEDAKFGTVTYQYNLPIISPYNPNAWVKIKEGNMMATKPEFYQEKLPVFLGTGRWLTYIIPLAPYSILKFNINGSGNTQALTELVKTITEHSR